MTADQIALEDAKKAFDMMEEAATDLLSDPAQYRFWEYIKKRAEDELEDSDVTGDELDELDEIVVAYGPIRHDDKEEDDD